MEEIQQKQDTELFNCAHCGEVFKTLAGRSSHLRGKHPGEYSNQYQCSYCPEKFERLSMLRYHETSHTGEAPFKCTTCGKGFMIGDKLRTHKWTHASKEEKYRFPCKECDKKFTQKFVLKAHVRKNHSPSSDQWEWEPSTSDTSSSMEESLDDNEGVENELKEATTKIVSEKVEQFLGLNLHPGLKIFGDANDIDVVMEDNEVEKADQDSTPGPKYSSRAMNKEDSKDHFDKYDSVLQSASLTKHPISKAMKKEIEKELGHNIYRGLRITIVK